MKRSEINAALRWAEALLEKSNIRLPRFAYWSMDEWRAHRDGLSSIRTVMQGWDITDFGSGDFPRIGAVLFTVRNGSLTAPGVGSPYAEKYILLREGQRLPNHYHASKTEDIINRSGGVMSMRLYNRLPDGGVDYESDVEVWSDGLKLTVKSGEAFDVARGDSVRLTPFMYHIFGAKEGAGDLVVGEVSAVNDDNTDNYFAEPVSRFADIEEDEPIYHPLCNEYDKLWLL
ncbi:MAG: D-lyxose/D-mannose family sugar isomerase [Clostridia bacterium]|nr:D-lyxose/D-mannose family sugar isomerase [Clostridia bacterium]